MRVGLTCFEVAGEVASEQLRDELLPEALDVHRGLRHEMADAFEPLRGAGRVDAAVGRRALVPHDFAVTRGAERGHLELRPPLPVLVPLLVRPDDLRDNLPRALDDDVVSDADVLPADIVLVMERRLFHRDAAHLHGFQYGVWVQRAGASDVDADAEQPRHGALRRELPGDGPARLPSYEPEVPLVVQPVDLHDDAVRLVVLVVAFAHPALVVGGDVVGRFEARDLRVDPEAELPQPLHRLPVRGRRLGVLRPAQLVDPDGELARRGDARVQLAQRACGGVAWVREQRLASVFAFLVHASEGVAREVDLAAHFHAGRGRNSGLQHERHRLDGPHV